MGLRRCRRVLGVWPQIAPRGANRVAAGSLEVYRVVCMPEVQRELRVPCSQTAGVQLVPRCDRA
jgi:hypothetical protein